MSARSFPRSALFACVLALPACFLFDSEDPIPQERADRDLAEESGGASERAVLPVPGLPGTYDRGAALAYVTRYAKSPNPSYAYCGARGRWDPLPADCTNFASQVLHAGGIPMERPGNEETGWWYASSCQSWGSSKSWRQVNRLLSYLVTETDLGAFRQRARDLQIGDLIFYRLRRDEENYRCGAGNLFNHTAIVSGFDRNGEPLVSYHSNDAADVPWAAKNGSLKALGEACATGFVHIQR